jgi:plasmid maintenance system antidote protein VapI
MTEQQYRSQYHPKLVSPPGETLGELLGDRGIRQIELASRMAVTPKFINELVAGKVGITPTTALALEKTLDVPAAFWLARDARYQESLARKESEAAMAGDTAWLDELPLRDMCRFKWIEEQRDAPAYVEACLRFFGVASTDAWRQHYVAQTTASAAYRMSAKVRSNPGAVAAWLREGERIAATVECSAFDRERFLETLAGARKLTLESDPAEFVPALVTSFAACGVAVTIVRAPQGCPISGAVRWLSPHKALLQLSMRYLRNDIFWFTFFHECGHLALHGKKILFLENDEMSGTEEDEANEFAANRLIPPDAWTSFAPPALTESVIREFAGSIGIAAGVVVGRLQHEGRVHPSRLNHLKTHYKWLER